MNIRKKIDSALTYLCSAALALIGYNCSSNDEPSEMYGTPTGTFEIKGTVKNENDKPIGDAEIRIGALWEQSADMRYLMTETDREGLYMLEGRMLWDSLKIVCIPSGDVYLPDSTTVALKYVYDKDHEKSEWYMGHATATVDFTLRENPEK